MNSDANIPTLQVASSGVSSVTIFKAAAGNTVINLIVRNLIIDGNSKTSIRGFDFATASGGGSIERCSAINCTNGAFVLTSGLAIVRNCLGTGCTTQPVFQGNAAASLFFGCVARLNSQVGFSFIGNGATAIFCVSDSNSGASTDGFQQPGGEASARCISCTSYNNGRDGFRFASNNARGSTSYDCLAYGNAGAGFNNAGTSPYYNHQCAGGSNTSGNESGVTESYSFVTLTADPFTSKSTGDMSLNTTAAGGAACRATGFPGAFPAGLTTGYLDIGAVQHQDAGGGGAALSRIFTGF
jgi:hypothetical protein